MPGKNMSDRERHEAGMKVRRAVLGDVHVERAEKNKTTFNEPFQDLITRYAWGEIWSRPGLSRNTRSLITLAMMIALNRNDESGSAAAKRNLLRRSRREHRLPYRPGSVHGNRRQKMNRSPKLR
jgi:hypothetical protein